MVASELQGAAAPLVGRGRECAVIDRLLERAAHGESGSLVLRGEAGVGKTALLSYAAARAGTMTTLSVVGVEAESDLDFAGLHSLMRPIVELLSRLPEPQRVALAAALGLAPAEGSDRFLVSAGVLSLLAAAEGNPLALLELPAALSDNQLTGRAAMPEALPLTERLRAAFMQRIDRLPAQTRAALLIASAEEAGGLGVILRAAAALGLPPDALDPAQETGLVQTDGFGLSFRHPLVRSAIYEAAPLGRRQRVHAALAVVLEGEEHAERAVWHRAMAALTPDEEVADALEASARRSQLRSGHASAASALERAAALSEVSSLRSKRLAAAVEAAWFAGQGDRARELVSRSLPIADRAQRARLLFLRGVIEGQSGRLLDGVATLQHGVGLSEDPSLTLQMLREGCAMAGHAGAHDEAQAFASRSAGISCVDELDRFTRVSLIARAADLSGDHKRGSALSAELVSLADGIEVPVCLIWAALAAARIGDLQASLRHANRAVRLTRDAGVVTTLPFCLQVQAAALIGQSRFDLAYASAEEGWRLALDTAQPWAAGRNVINGPDRRAPRSGRVGAGASRRAPGAGRAQRRYLDRTVRRARARAAGTWPRPGGRGTRAAADDALGGATRVQSAVSVRSARRGRGCGSHGPARRGRSSRRSPPELAAGITRSGWARAARTMPGADRAARRREAFRAGARARGRPVAV
jgi:tetratricopeptide (TPR) repeat protein